ncbi:hypothetical protein CKO42_19395 [Lamprobacter modestohalophilus]|uniref:Uncharacterized protein n=1 Tax=Lamprobacter modestohalophilus TaxID=1064514 RepID=A0A9X0WBT3_9GAMM|nr:hypothetical protein [Lamprobacter modestohalophilus]
MGLSADAEMPTCRQAQIGADAAAQPGAKQSASAIAAMIGVMIDIAINDQAQQCCDTPRTDHTR